MMEPAVGQDGAYAPRGGMGKSAFGHSKNVNETRPAPPAGKESRHEKRTVGVRAGFSRRGYAYYFYRAPRPPSLKSGGGAIQSEPRNRRFTFNRRRYLRLDRGEGARPVFTKG